MHEKQQRLTAENAGSAEKTRREREESKYDKSLKSTGFMKFL
jgi:hypothetical protein